ncbi:amino acid/polyamine/organocation transporter (APC superfamily) [Stenotrophomonas maltophilia]|uniref:amino acid permease n=1 Tax=Stenotrophomonas TaxID=40323 RepID=UPI000F4B30ED|nr:MULTISPECIES: amino acid permease [Stenotrophomonas]MCS4230830.1 APA family basic amino acid/polyamine antiporter [Stenotrophomonas chelatiphaga]MDR6094254.1 APA family basic amino acid/polyamine antiporter [Stenotrophomonas sp. SORGH_AS_0321]ROQ48411.1 amino acid/polyamine/organocation transporter (APC superfamily) [Stenotrophomonas maltophilia]
MLKALLRVKPVEPAGHVDAGEPIEGSLDGEATLKRTLTAKHLILLGIGAVIGAGIFVMTGQAAAFHAGPAVTLSFVAAGLACALAGLCYAEFAAMMPVSGSAYSYSYATLGEGMAWFIGWCLVLEYLFASASVAVGWSAYLISFITTTLHLPFPDALSAAPVAWESGQFIASGKLFNLPAVLIVAAVTGLLYVGVSQSTFVNGIIVAIKVTVICLFIAIGATYVNPANWHPFIPENTGTFGEFGWSGVLRAGSIVFFAFIGFDAVSTAAGETKDPQRNMPIGLLGSLAICTVIYVIVCLVLTGLLPYQQLGTSKPVATALEAYPQLAWLKTFVEIGAIAGLSSVVLVMMMGQTRIAYTISRDGLLPKMFGKVHARFRTPYVATVVVGVIAALLAGLMPLSVLGELVSMGTLLAFATVCVGVLVLRYTRPELVRPFRVPMVWLICPLGALACLTLFAMAFREHWHLFVGWTVLGLLIYFGYGMRNSKLAKSS